MLTYLSEEELERNFKFKIEEILRIPIVVKIRTIDPRITYYVGYANITKGHIEKMKQVYPNLKVTRGIFGIKKIESSVSLEEFFTIYVVKNDRQKYRLYGKHEVAYLKQKEKDIREGVKY